MGRKSLRWLICSGLLALVFVAGCGDAIKNPQTGLQEVSRGDAGAVVDRGSLVRFALSRGYSARYALRTAVPISKLRHGHREFTIDLVDSGVSLFIVFYGYQGPGNYTLSQYSNGGDVHVGLGKEGLSWDLTMQARAECTMTVSSDRPMGESGLDRMKGSFVCPFLYSSVPAHPQKPVTITGGSFDIAIIVES